MTAEKLMSDISEVLKNEVAERHSYFQMKYFIVNKEPTHQSKMWQCIREIKARYESLLAVDMEVEDSKENLELMQMDIDTLGSALEKKKSLGKSQKSLRRTEIRLSKARRQRLAASRNLEALEKKRKNLEEEAAFFVAAFRSLQSAEPLRNFDDIDAQKQYWGEKLLQKINLKMLLQSHVETELIETVLALPDDIPIKEQTIRNLDTCHKQMVQMKKQAEQITKQETNGN